MMKYIILLSFTLVLIACSNEQEPGFLGPLIPNPDSIEMSSGYSEITELIFSNDNAGTKYYNSINDLSFNRMAIKQSADYNIKFESLAEEGLEGAYYLQINKREITIKANDEEGKFNALSTLIQITLFNDNLPIANISASPKFQYRGMHLDVCRHFFPIADVKKYIDYLFFYGYNKFHWHLTEDQGWRIEIKQYPKLQEVAAFRKETLIGHYNDVPQKFDGKRYGGFYTQDEVKDIVRYASEKGIEVIPEIEMPGHSLAAIAAYPELACENKPYDVGTKWGVFHDIYCPSEATFEFLENVIDEVVDLFPSKYIHIGGDEAPKTAWRNSQFCQDLIKSEGLKDEHELQSYFIKRMEKYINSKGRSIIGWDEILEGGLAPNATVMSWRGIAGGIDAANAGHDVIMTPTSHCYFDYYQSNNPNEPLAIGGYLPLEKVYNYNPIPSVLEKDKHHHILGAQGNVWTEYMPSFKNVEYMALSRMAALSEVLWKEKEDKDFTHFFNALTAHQDFWKSKGVNISDYRFDVFPKVYTEFNKGAYVDIKELPKDAYIEYKVPGFSIWNSDINFPFYLKENGRYVFRAANNTVKGRPIEKIFQNHLGTRAAVLLVNPPADQYSGLGAGSINNGILGSDEKYGGDEWLGFQGYDFVAEYVFPEKTDISKINLKFFNGNGQWIYLPKKVEVFRSDDGKSFKSINEINNIGTLGKIANVSISTKDLKTKFLKVVAKNFGKIPQGKQGEGNQAWLFVDEVIIE
ncbi:MAG: family 20 glycosylhydrolase [Saprospiraceae bacterium]|nr:family 20 glycosylhydrolase [Saprospiraceae bacterium]